MLQWLKDFFRPFHQSVCRHASSSAKTTFDPESSMGGAGWAFMKWECTDCGLKRHRIIPAPPEMYPGQGSLQSDLLLQQMRDEAFRNRLH